VITRDQKIHYRPAERQAWVDYAVRGFVLTGKGSQSTADSQAVLRRHWRTIRLIVDAELDGPWMRAVTNQGLRAIDLL
jgi:hypothetical protein